MNFLFGSLAVAEVQLKTHSLAEHVFPKLLIDCLRIGLTHTNTSELQAAPIN